MESFGGTGRSAGAWQPMSPTPFSAKMIGKQGQAATKAAITNSSQPDYSDFGSSTVLRYPENVGVDPDQGHWILFDIYKQDPAKLQASRAKKAFTSGEISSAGDLGINVENFTTATGDALTKAGKQTGPNSIAVKSNATTRISTTIGLYMPPSISVQYGAKYADQDIGRFAESIPSAIAAFQAVGGGALDVIGVGLKGLAGKGIELGMKGLPAGTKAVAEIAMGAIIAPRMELMFEGINRRNFSFSFQFVPKNNKESDIVKQIVNKFKFHMASNYGNPTSDILVGGTYTAGSDGVRNMTIPDFFEIHYMYKNGLNSNLNKIKKCVLQTMDVSYGDDRYVSYADGAPQTTKMTLNFQELEIITKDYISQGY